MDIPGSQEIEKTVLWEALQRLLKKARQVREQASLQAQANELNGPPTDDSGYDSHGVASVPTQDAIQTSDSQSTLSDPFLGSMPHLGEEMDWEAWDGLVQNFQSGLYPAEGPSGQMDFWGEAPSWY